MKEAEVVQTLPGLERDDSPPIHEMLHRLNAELEKPRLHGLAQTV